MLTIDDLFTSKLLDGKNGMKDGCKVSMDYNGVIWRYSPAIEQRHSDDIMRDMVSFSLYLSSSRISMGEGMILALMKLFEKMNSDKDIQFPIDDIKGYAKSTNEIWSARMEMLLKYYAENHVDVPAEDYEYTVLLDEPDRNLDIKHIKELFNVLSYHRPVTQLVCVIHNPVLIYKLMQTDVHFVELTPDYLNKIKSFIEWAK